MKKKISKGSSPAKTQNPNSLSIQASYEGPLPQANDYGRYEQICPGAADRILAMAENEQISQHKTLEKQQEHLHKMQEIGLKGEISEIRVGQILAFSIAVITIFVGAYTAMNGAEIAGGIIGVGGVTGLVLAFIKGRDK